MRQDTLHNTGPPLVEGADPDEATRFLERFALTLAERGFPRGAARVFAALIISEDGSRTAGELAELLNIGAPAVSGAVKFLTGNRLVVRERDPGERRDRYRVVEDMWTRMFSQRADLLRSWEERAAEGVAVLGPDSAAGRRLNEARLFFAFIQAEAPEMIRRWTRLRARALAEESTS